MSSGPYVSLSPDQVTSIRLAYLTDSSMTIKALAESYKCSHLKVAACLKGPEYDSFKADLQTAMKTLAADKLTGMVERAADLWGTSMLPAAIKGDHRPMRDLLIAAKVVEERQTLQPPVTVNIGISLEPGAIVLLPPAPTPAKAPATLPSPIEVLPSKT